LFEIILKWELSVELGFKYNVLCKSIAVVSKNIQFDMNYTLKNTLLQMAAWALTDEPE